MSRPCTNPTAIDVSCVDHESVHGDGAYGLSSFVATKLDEVFIGEPCSWLHVEMMTDPDLQREDGEEPGWSYSVNLGDRLFSVWITEDGEVTVNEL